LMLRPTPWPVAADGAYGLRRQLPPRRFRSPPPWTASVLPSGVGVRALSRTVSMACRRRRARVDRGACPPAERVEVLAMAPEQPPRVLGPATGARLDGWVAARPPPRRRPLGRSTLWRILEEGALPPPRSVAWRPSHAPALAGKTQALCPL